VGSAKKIVNELNPVQIQIPEKEYAAVVPYQAIRGIFCKDSWIKQLVDAVWSSKGILHALLDDVAGGTDYDAVERMAPHICQNHALLPQRFRRFSTDIQKQIVGLHCGIAALKMMPQHIFEDLTLGLNTKMQNATIKASSNEIIRVRDGVFLEDRRRDGRFEFEPGAKARLLSALLQGFTQKGLRSVVFCRTIRLLESLKKTLKPLKIELYELTGEMADELRAVSIRNFRKSAAGILLMTRTTGGRGLDLPFASCAVFYSPKTDPVQMWQEMSRIRSTVSMPKETFVLCYEGTVEPETLTSIVVDLKGRQLKVEVGSPALERFVPKEVLAKVQ
jgi:SNF2 family DNA or RNA helicase